ncbi:LLM class flavin-dependent oxidoreductase [Lentzea sp. NPDC059081]|uniref:LLM class flavin-dependent oxidoreductase n=1 Tax=Lentzea sp. NPDC059081 TaxID=3346719 RepID=UPI0036D0C279
MMEDIRFAVHSGQLHGTVEACVELWQRAEELGYDSISIFDFLRPWAYPPDWPCFEGTTLLAALASRTSRIRCAMMVSPITWRHPAVMANIASTLDHISGGRLEFGVGAGGTDRAYEQYGIPFPSTAVRAGMLDEACRVLRSLWERDETTFHGEHYTFDRACLAPKPVQARLPLIVGANGLRHMIPLAARHADVWNSVSASPQEYRRKVEVFDDACERAGRDPGEVRKSITFRAVVTPSGAGRRTSSELADTPDAIRNQYISFGSAEQCVEALAPYVELGATDFVLAVKAPVDWQTLELVATQVAPAVRQLARDRRPVLSGS